MLNKRRKWVFFHIQFAFIVSFKVVCQPLLCLSSTSKSDDLLKHSDTIMNYIHELQGNITYCSISIPISLHPTQKQTKSKDCKVLQHSTSKCLGQNISAFYLSREKQPESVKKPHKIQSNLS